MGVIRSDNNQISWHDGDGEWHRVPHINCRYTNVRVGIPANDADWIAFIDASIRLLIEQGGSEAQINELLDARIRRLGRQLS